MNVIPPSLVTAAIRFARIPQEVTSARVRLGSN